MVEILIGGASMTSREVSFVVTEEYRAWIENIKQKIRQSQIKASVKVNYAMLDLYWDIGRDIVIKQKTAKWGDAFLPCPSALLCGGRIEN